MIPKAIKEFNTLIKGGFLHLFFSNFLIQFMVFGSQMLVAGLLLPEDFGRIKILQTYVDVASIIGGGGFVVAIMKLIPETKDVNEKRKILSYSSSRVIFISFLVFLVLNILSFFHLISSDKLVNSFFHVFSIIILFSPISLIMVRYFQALDEFKKISYIQTITKFITVLLILFLTKKYLVIGYINGVVISFIITFLVMLFFLKEHFVFFKGLNKNTVFKINKLSRYQFYTHISDQLRVHSGFFVASYLIIDREVFGQYSFALIIIQGLGILSSSMQQFMIPKFSEKSKDKDFFFRMVKVQERKYIIISFFIFLIAQLIIPPIIELIFHDKYSSSIPFFRILLFGWFFYSFYTLKGPALIGLGRLEISFKISALIFVIMLPVSIIFCYYFRVYGITYAYITQTIISIFVNKYYFKKIFSQNV